MNKLVLAAVLAALGAPAASPGGQAGPAAAAAPAPSHICGQEVDPGTPSHKPPVMLDGFGTGGFPIRTANPAAQRWFDYGMKLAHAFNHQPAVDAFAEGVRVDPNCAMCAWGEAWAMGPTINFDVDDKARARAAELAAKAAVLAEGGPEKERLLTAALKTRYDPALGKGAYKAFAQAMDKVAARFPTDNEIAIVTADAWMIALPDDRIAQNRAMALLADALKRDPNDTGAIHFYIHITENAGVAGYALPFARRLGELAPAAGHLVHMPSHTYIRVGLYADAAEANAAAVEADKAFLAKGGAGELWKNSYHAHNVTFGLSGAVLAGDARQALFFADELGDLARTVTVKEPWLQSSASRRYVAYGRFADPARVLALPEPDRKLVYLHAMWRYARGEALARKGDAAGVLAEASAMTPDDADLAAMGGSRAGAEGLITIARHVLEGRAAMLQGRWDKAADAYRQAASLQEAKFSGNWDPPSWWFPVRRSLAEAELRAGRLDAAEADAHAVLKIWLDDGVTERVLADVDRARGHDGKAWLDKARAHWKGDVEAIRPADV
jgi:tetratricopeptide (TPR) repeat protein